MQSGCPARLVLMFVLLHCLLCYEQINDDADDDMCRSCINAGCDCRSGRFQVPCYSRTPTGDVAGC